jgi:hypothetical protein
LVYHHLSSRDVNIVNETSWRTALHESLTSGHGNRAVFTMNLQGKFFYTPLSAKLFLPSQTASQISLSDFQAEALQTC